MIPQYQLTTSRLVLKLIELDECDQFAEMIQNSPHLYPWLDWCHPHFNREQAKEFILHTRLNWVKSLGYGFGIYTVEDHKLIGMAALTDQAFNFNMGTVGYWIRDSHQHFGYATEATSAVVNFCFREVKLTRVEFICDPENLASHKVALACGATNEGIARNRFIFRDKPHDGLVFSMIPSDLKNADR